MVEGSPISKHFKAIFASSFRYDHNGVAIWPALALNHTTKTQYLFRINKGSLNVYDHAVINKYVEKSGRKIPFENMIFIGDGETDIPCFRLVKEQGGHSIADYSRRAKGRETADKLMADGRVNFIAPASYEDGKALDKIVKAIIDKLAADRHLYSL